MRVLVVFHIYYSDLIQYYLQKMENIHSCQWDLVVTCSEFSEDVRSRVLAVKPDAKFVRTSNVGYDIWPFIDAVQQSDLGLYDFVIKLHTKNEDSDFSIVLNGVSMTGPSWKEYLVEPLLGDRRHFAGLLEIFGRPRVGLTYSRQLGFVSKGVKAEDCQMLDAELARLGIRRRRSHFCAGTMMAVRACALKFLQDSRINAGIFQVSGPSHSGATMAHVYERLIPIAVQAQGYVYHPLYDSHRRAIHFKLKDVFTPILEWIFSINHYGSEDTKAVVLFGHRFILR